MKCEHIKSDETQCKAHAVTDSEFCYHHNPDIPEEEKKESQRRGGLNRGLTVDKPLLKMEVAEAEDVVLLVGDTIKRVRAGTLDVRTANCLFIGSEKMLRALEFADLVKKVDRILERIETGEIKT